MRIGRTTKVIQYFSVARRDIVRRRPRMTSAASVVSINTDFARTATRFRGDISNGLMALLTAVLFNVDLCIGESAD